MKNTFKIVALLITFSAFQSCNNKPKLDAKPSIEVDSASSVTTENKVVELSEVNWGALNPARGEKGPRAGNLWGDRTASEASGFLVKFLDGFASPPHIHNITYRGVVIEGLLHNDDPSAEKMWLPPVSFWTQPAGEVHITAADATANMAYIEIDSGPYLVLPTEEAFDNGDKPINVDNSNIVWLEAKDIVWNEPQNSLADLQGVKVAFLWGEPNEGKMSGRFLKLPSAFQGAIKSNGSVFRGVVIQGKVNYQLTKENNPKILEPGSYFGSDGKSIHQINTNPEGDAIVYIRTDGKIEIVN